VQPRGETVLLLRREREQMSGASTAVRTRLDTGIFPSVTLESAAGLIGASRMRRCHTATIAGLAADREVFFSGRLVPSLSRSRSVGRGIHGAKGERESSCPPELVATTSSTPRHPGSDDAVDARRRARVDAASADDGAGA
jgi:hypothetical protein